MFSLGDLVRARLALDLFVICCCCCYELLFNLPYIMFVRVKSCYLLNYNGDFFNRLSWNFVPRYSYYFSLDFNKMFGWWCKVILNPIWHNIKWLRSCNMSINYIWVPKNGNPLSQIYMSWIRTPDRCLLDNGHLNHWTITTKTK